MWNIGYCYSEWLRSMVIYIHIAIVSRMSNLVEQKNLSRTPTIMVTSHHFRSCHHLLLQKQGGKSSLCQVTLTHTHTHTHYEKKSLFITSTKSPLFFKSIHPGKLPWNLKITELKRNIIVQTSLYFIIVSCHMHGIFAYIHQKFKPNVVNTSSMEHLGMYPSFPEFVHFGTLPSLLGKVSSAPWSSKQRTTPRWLRCAAMKRGVSPLRLALLMS